jgi:hypothetical protein
VTTPDQPGAGAREQDRDRGRDVDDDLDDIGAQRFPLAIFPLGLLVLVAIVAGLLLADRDDTGLTPSGSTPSTVTVPVSTGSTSPH